MNHTLPSPEASSPFSQWIAGWRLVAVTALFISSGAVFLMMRHNGDVDSIRLVIRLTARVSLGLFCLAFSASAANRIWPNAWTRWQVANRRYLGLSFAVSHFIHAIAILIFVGLYARQFHDVHPGSNVVGGIGYFFLLAMAVTSFDRTAALIGSRVWRTLHATGGYVLWTIFLLSEVSRRHQGSIHLWFAAPLLLVAAIRILAWWRARSIVAAGRTIVKSKRAMATGYLQRVSRKVRANEARSKGLASPHP